MATPEERKKYLRLKQMKSKQRNCVSSAAREEEQEKKESLRRGWRWPPTPK